VLWTSERKHLADIDVANAGNPAAVLAAVVNGGA
jgi:hypothetical protein